MSAIPFPFVSCGLPGVGAEGLRAQQATFPSYPPTAGLLPMHWSCRCGPQAHVRTLWVLREPWSPRSPDVGIRFLRNLFPPPLPAPAHTRLPHGSCLRTPGVGGAFPDGYPRWQSSALFCAVCGPSANGRHAGCPRASRSHHCHFTASPPPTPTDGPRPEKCPTSTGSQREAPTPS